jgi:putative toxin-antitoxin system antitoxin component (TIGR02293 family)
MSATMRRPIDPSDQGDLIRVTNLLGGPRVLKARPSTQLDVHRLLKTGLPQKALDHLVVSVKIVKGGRHFEDAFGMTYRTYQRRKDPGKQPLSAEQSGKTWTFARVLAKATEVFGSQEAAEKWISEPVMGLDRQVPLELLQTPAGVDLVNAFLTRLEYGVYT